MTTHRADFRFTNPGALIAALPAVLGFVPEKSLVLVSIEDGQMGAVMRADLSAGLTENVDRLAELAASSGADTAVAVVVDADGALCPVCDEDHRQLCTALTAALESQDIELSAAHVVDRVEAGGVWRCVDGCGATGSVDDPNASPLAAAAVLDGRRLYARRADLQSVIAVVDAAHSSALADLIVAATERRAAAWQSDPDGCGRRDLENAIATAARVGSGGELADGELAELACAITDVAVRDTLYALAVGAEAAQAEALWALLSRSLPDPWRAEALVLLAFSAYARGDGPVAGISLEAALRSDPGHRMAGMLDTALQSGLRPEEIRRLAGTGYRLAKLHGVRLPRQRAFGQRTV